MAVQLAALAPAAAGIGFREALKGFLARPAVKMGSYALAGLPIAFDAINQLIHPDLRPPTAGLPVLQVPNNLTDDERPFVGRAKERADVRRKLATGERLVTLTGPGGMGKTRLGLQGKAARPNR